MLAGEALAAKANGEAEPQRYVALARFFAENIAVQAPSLEKTVTESAEAVTGADAVLAGYDALPGHRPRRIHSRRPGEGRDDTECVARSVRHTSAFSRHDLSELCASFRPLLKQRAQGKRRCPTPPSSTIPDRERTSMAPLKDPITKPVKTRVVDTGKHSYRFHELQVERLGLRGTIYLVDDDPEFSGAAQRLLELAGYHVQSFPSAERLLAQQLHQNRVDCILLDVRLPAITGPDLQQQLIAQNVELPIIFLSGYEDIPITVRTIKSGAEDFLRKPVTAEILLSTIERAIDKHKTSQQRREEKAIHRTNAAKLTPRERDVFERVVEGKLNKQIANEFGSTVRTIKAHRQRVMEKMQARSLAELVLMAEQLKPS